MSERAQAIAAQLNSLAAVLVAAPDKMQGIKANFNVEGMRHYGDQLIQSLIEHIGDIDYHAIPKKCPVYFMSGRLLATMGDARHPISELRHYIGKGDVYGDLVDLHLDESVLQIKKALCIVRTMINLLASPDFD